MLPRGLKNTRKGPNPQVEGWGFSWVHHEEGKKRDLDQAATQKGGCGPAQAKKRPEEERGVQEEKENRERCVACGALVSF